MSLMSLINNNSTTTSTNYRIPIRWYSPFTILSTDRTHNVIGKYTISFGQRSGIYSRDVSGPTVDRPHLLQSPPLHSNSGLTKRTTTSNGGDDVPSTTRSGTSPPSPPNDTSKSIDWVALLAELALSVGLAIVTSMLLTFITRTVLKGIFPQQNRDPSVDDTTTSETQVYRRLKQILIKRSGGGGGGDPNDPQAHKNIVVA